MADEIEKNIYKLNIPLPDNPLKNLNSYLICGAEKNLLIDTGFCMKACHEAIKAELARFSIDMNKTDIFLTHMHSDHSGLAAELASENTKTYVSSLDADRLGPVNLSLARKQLSAMYISEGFPLEELRKSFRNIARRKMISSRPIEYTRLEDGDVLSYGGYELVCILTPGHTPGHMCLYCEKLKLMFLGDHILFGITPNIVRWPNFENSLKRYMFNLQKAGKYEIKIALPAHRLVDCTVEERIRSIVAHHKERLIEVFNIIRRSPGQTAYDIAGQMTWAIRCNSWAVFPPSQKIFAVGEALAHIDYLLECGDIFSIEKEGICLYYTNRT